MHDIVAEGAGVPATVLVGVEARQHLRSQVLIAEQTHFPPLYYFLLLQMRVHLKEGGNIIWIDFSKTYKNTG